MQVSGDNRSKTLESSRSQKEEDVVGTYLYPTSTKYTLIPMVIKTKSNVYQY